MACVRTHASDLGVNIMRRHAFYWHAYELTHYPMRNVRNIRLLAFIECTRLYPGN